MSNPTHNQKPQTPYQTLGALGPIPVKFHGTFGLQPRKESHQPNSNKNPLTNE